MDYDRWYKRRYAKDNLWTISLETLYKKRKTAFEYILIDLANTLICLCAAGYLFYINDTSHYSLNMFISWAAMFVLLSAGIWFFNSIEDHRRMDWIDFVIYYRMEHQA